MTMASLGREADWNLACGNHQGQWQITTQTDPMISGAERIGCAMPMIGELVMSYSLNTPKSVQYDRTLVL
ncbi:hypothetical protein, partial [Leisingera sp.]|uniref:hypothetical protein n=1 Tax=Leisingera sp. TaxID=1879318 RepID=UPI002B273426